MAIWKIGRAPKRSAHQPLIGMKIASGEDSLSLTPQGRLIADRLTHEMLR